MLKAHRKSIIDILGRGPIHPFPARMAPGIALEALGEENSGLHVLDPMSGSGTVLAVARARGHRAYGIDLDPLAVLLAGVWTRAINPHEVREKAEEVLNGAKAKFNEISTAAAYPDRSNEQTRDFIRYWFDAYARRQLTALACAIGRVQNEVARDALWCGFSRLIVTKQAGASLAMDLSHSRPHKWFDRAPIKPFNKFISAVDIVVSNCPKSGSNAIGPPANVRLGDARKLDLKDGSIDLVLTSPPYLNAIDYMRCSKFSLVWMGYNIEELQSIRSNSVGAELALDEAIDTDWVKLLIKQLRLAPRLSDRNYAMLARYVWDMQKALEEVTRVLRRGGRAVYVIGDSMTRGTFIRNSSIVKAVAERCGLELLSKHSRSLPANRRYLPPPAKRREQRDQIGTRLRQEIIVTFGKAS